jgi:hypothetical protein
VPFTYILTVYLNYIHPSIILLSPHLRTISTGFIVLFSYTYTKYIHYIHLPYLLSLYPSPTRISPPGPISLSCSSFLNCILIAQKGNCILICLAISHMYTMYLNPISPLYYLLSLYPLTTKFYLFFYILKV